MTVSADIENKLEGLLNSLRQNRYKLEQYLVTLQSQQQTLLESFHKIMDELLILQSTITGSLTSFEEKAGASQGLQGLFHGNPLLKNEIMQKRLFMEQNAQKIREMSYQLQQKINQLGKTIQDIGRHISPEILAEEKDVEEIQKSVVSKPGIIVNSP